MKKLYSHSTNARSTGYSNPGLPFILILFVLACCTFSNLSAQCLQWGSPAATTLNVCDQTTNNPQFWNDPLFKDTLTNQIDLSEGSFDQNFVVEHAGCGVPTISFELQMDLDDDGIRETAVTTANAQADGTLFFDNITGSGTQVEFDSRPAAASQKYKFDLVVSTVGTTTTAKLVWTYTDGLGQPQSTVPQLPIGLHKLIWTASFGTEMVSKEVLIEIKDCKKPIIVCINGISINVFPAPSNVILWASDFLQYVEDNLTPTGQIELGIRRYATGTGFPVEADGSPVDSIQVSCADLGLVLVELWAKDKAGNVDYCETYAVVQDNFSVCGPSNVGIIYEAATSCTDIGLLYVNTASFVAPFPFVSYLWNTGATTSSIEVYQNGTYSVMISYPLSGLPPVTLSYTVTDVPQNCAIIEGKVVRDLDADCQYDIDEPGLIFNTVKVTDSQNNVLYRQTDNNGNYRVRVDPGAYTVEVIPANNLWDNCQPNYPVQLVANQVEPLHIPMSTAAVLCPALSITQSAPILRRCFSDNHIYGQYFNSGTATAEAAYIIIELDPFLTLQSSNLPYTDLGNHQYRLELGDVPYGTVDYFVYTVAVSCDAQLGQTHCTTATIFPQPECGEQPLNWSGGSLRISSECAADSLHFYVKNIGTGPITQPLEYIVIEDIVMFRNGQIQPLAPGDQMDIAVPANGATWRLEAEQEANHPGLSMPSLSVEGCATGQVFSTGIVQQFPQDDADPWIDEFCIENIGSFDPNDKQGFPLGYSNLHQINQNTDIEYMIRFQNTGTDTAFTVVIRDTLSPFLDPATIRPGASSHAYTFDFYGAGPNIRFVFDNIRLPDSSSNLAASQGFVSYRISQQPDVPLGTDILNSAAIYFDYNEPVITNTTQHRVDKDFIVVGSWAPAVHAVQLQCMPNPTNDMAWLTLKNSTQTTPVQIEVLDAYGHLVRSATSADARWKFERNDLPAGVYTIRVANAQGLIGIGKLMVQ